ncbi:MAG: hypothetical protein SGILL_009825, partial [Bacillariaceae sp.]
FALFLLTASSFQKLSVASAFSMPSTTKTIYDIVNSGWTSPEWNWGSAVGTGHDCAAICRRKYTTRKERSRLVEDLVQAPSLAFPRDRKPQNFEEVKLILALAWQRGRWDGSDGGRGGYGDVLGAMADARRYEDGEEEDCSRILVQDMADRFALLDPLVEDRVMMQNVFDLEPDIDAARRRCCGLVLRAMGFIENGL